MAGFQHAQFVGVIPARLALPGGLAGRQRVVRISRERIGHIAARRPEWLSFCLTEAAVVLADPEYLGYRPQVDPRRVEFVRRVGGRPTQLMLVAVKFLDDKTEAWVSTAHPLKSSYLTRRLRAGTMRSVSRGP